MCACVTGVENVSRTQPGSTLGVSKLLYSALAAIEQVAGVPREEVAGKAYMRRNLDPHALVAGGEAEGTA